ncbi:PilW family protein [Motiliproteus sp. SC1-56]|uniref:PilW family protein n=1 Tax=Motiliproteus sp. SC1-56 TaxID=2799565 RepID=UPI001A9065E7|nr:PilW family protein [Motiliproteus sp. SC1-56]
MVNPRQQGFSLVELMVAMVLGLLIVAAVLQTFLAGKRSYEMQEDLSRIQENGRFAIEFLTRDIRQAGFWGCLGPDSIPNNHLKDKSNPLYGFTGSVSGAESSDYTAEFANDKSVTADRILLGGGGVDSSSPIQVTRKKSPNPSESTQVSKNSGIEDEDIIVITDCKTADILQVTGVNTSSSQFDGLTHNQAPGYDPGNDGSVDMSTDYHGAPVSNIFKLNNRIYTVSLAKSSGEPALYRNGEELVEGIESMQFLYGVVSGGNMSYLPADSANMDDVVSVKVSVLARGFGNVANEPVTFQYNDGTSSAAISFTAKSGDRRLRKVFSSTIALRNRLD